MRGPTRRQFLRTGLLFSAALMVPRRLSAAAPQAAALDLFCFGDWGTGDANQRSVAAALRAYARKRDVTPQALFLLGDNFYGPLTGVDSPRWKAEFEDMYPAADFPGRCYVVLGNHDYDDQPGGENIQLAYAREPGTRWTLPDLWYRLELPVAKPVVTILCTNTHYAKLTPEQIARQNAWLETELSRPSRTPWRLVVGHHPVESCGLHVGNNRNLAPWRDLFARYDVTAYLCGHEHDLQHLRVPGQPTDYWVSGGGGRNLHAVRPNEDTVFARETFGFLHLALTADRCHGTFVGTDAEPLYSAERRRA